MSAALLVFDDVAFAYGARPVLDGVTASVARGELVGIVGPNGAGKSTLVRLALGLLAPARGTVRLDGEDVRHIARRAFARRVAAVLQEESLEFPFTALEVVLMGRTAHLGPLGFESEADVAAARAAMAATDVAHLEARPMDALSGGERKRVFLARALAQGPELLLLDEPAASLDLAHVLDIFDLLAKRRREGLAVVVVVHDLNLAATYCDRVVVLAQGAPARVGPTEEMLTPATIREVFGVDVWVGTEPATGKRLVVPVGR